VNGRWVPWAGLVARLVLGGVFIYAGALKVGDARSAGAAIQAYRLLPSDVARTIGYALPAIEIALGVLLVIGLFTRIAAALIGVLLVAFMIGVASVWIRGYSIDCGCFGGGGDVSADGKNWRYTVELIRDTGMLLLAGFLVWRPRTALSIDALMTPEPLPFDDDERDEFDDETHAVDDALTREDR
jgi:uncharacterized membrane protein YphA (DoxX/SURF4 family)